MRLRHILTAALGCLVLVVGAALVFRLPLERAALLAPIIVTTVGVTAFIVLLWTKVAVQALREQRHPRRILFTGVAVLALLVLLSFFVELPSGH